MYPISIIIPIYNEIEKLPQLIKHISPYKSQNQIIIINDGSHDGTREFLDSQSGIMIIHHDKNLGKGCAVRTALKKVNKEIVMLLDGDLEINIASLDSLIKNAKNNQIIIGYRISKSNSFSITEFGNDTLNFIFNILFSSNYKDVLCCLKILPAKTLRSFNLSAVGFELETEIMAKICINNLDVVEEKVQYKRRTNREGKKLRFADSFTIIKTMTCLKLKSLV